ncbi:Orf91 [Heliothis zea nudivirus]|uniref:Orf91 n=1 Tax=Heliothis zea nudivirus 1 TaxID=3116536 RepID=Q8JKM2_9VIRU|nr:Orf91 [Heliothis zea nudivirus]AAN04385.1 Orf91 [Heliothis zea nudivirus]
MLYRERYLYLLHKTSCYINLLHKTSYTKPALNGTRFLSIQYMQHISHLFKYRPGFIQQN